MISEPSHYAARKPFQQEAYRERTQQLGMNCQPYKWAFLEVGPLAPDGLFQLIPPQTSPMNTAKLQTHKEQVFIGFVLGYCSSSVSLHSSNWLEEPSLPRSFVNTTLWSSSPQSRGRYIVPWALIQWVVWFSCWPPGLGPSSPKPVILHKQCNLRRYWKQNGVYPTPAFKQWSLLQSSSHVQHFKPSLCIVLRPPDAVSSASRPETYSFSSFSPLHCFVSQTQEQRICGTGFFLNKFQWSLWTISPLSLPFLHVTWKSNEKRCLSGFWVQLWL